MPIADNVYNAGDLRSVGFTQEQASLLAAKFEHTAVRQREELKSFFRQRLDLFRFEMQAEFSGVRGEISSVRREFGGLRAEFGELRGEIHSSLRDQLDNIVAIVAALITAAVAILKLVPPSTHW